MPSKDDKSKVPAVAEPKQPSPTSSWAAGAPPSAAAPAEPAPPATPTGKKPGLASGTPANKTPGGGGGAAAGIAGIDPLMLAALSSMLDEKLAKQAAGFNQQLGALKERVDIAEAIAESRESGRSSGDERSGDDADDDAEFDDTDDDDRLSVLDDHEYFLSLDVKANKHFGVAALANAGEYKPHRHDLYGHKPYMVLTKGGNDTGGSLAFTLSYAEPISLYLKGVVDKLDQLAEAFAAGDYDPHEFCEDLVACRNTARETYNLANRMRSIVVQKARAQRPGATVYDKAEVKYLERVLDERDYATADTADEIAQLRKGFAKRSNKAELDRLSKSAGGGGGGGGGHASDDSSDDEGSRSKSRSRARRDKAKERKRNGGGERPQRGGGRDDGRGSHERAPTSGNGRGSHERTRREQGSRAADAETQRSRAGRRDDGAGAKREGRRGGPGGGARDGGGRQDARPPRTARDRGSTSDDAGSDDEAGFE